MDGSTGIMVSINPVSRPAYIYDSTSDTWIPIVGLQGDTGPIGATGPTGPTGDAGPTGPTGAIPTTLSDATLSTAAVGYGYMGIPQNATTTGAYRLVVGDSGKHIYSTATRTITIPGNTTGANPQVAFPVGSTIVFVNATGTTVTLSMDGTTTDTCLLAGTGTSMTGGTGSRTLAPFGMATLVKITTTSWIISGNGLT
jgi:hypothetical protein